MADCTITALETLRVQRMAIAFARTFRYIHTPIHTYIEIHTYIRTHIYI